jgi:hypothetical protein
MEIMLLWLVVWRAINALVGSEASSGFLVVLLFVMSSSERERGLGRPMSRSGRRVTKMRREGVRDLLGGSLMTCPQLKGATVLGMVAAVGPCMVLAGFLLVSMRRLSVGLGC